MQFDFALNTFFGSSLIVIIIFADCVSKYNADYLQKRIFCSLLIFSFISMAADCLCFLFDGIPGKTIGNFLYGISFIYYFFQVLAYYYIIIFLDYLISKDTKRAKIITRVVFAIAFAHMIILLLNFKWHFYFYYDEITNTFFRGDKFIIRILISSFPALFIIYELAAFRKTFNKSNIVTIAFLLVLFLPSTIFDMLFKNVFLIWPCIAAVVLYCYFFNIQTDTRIDSLTGIGNRYSFNEFTDRLSRRNTGETWTIVMIDMDHFKAINDTFGHQEGDNALRDMAAIIKKCIRSSDFAARYGGDEFILAARMESGVTNLMNRIQDEIIRHNSRNIRPFKIDISYGFDVYKADGSGSIDEFLNHIDSLMYSNKENRRRAEDKKQRGPA